MTTVKPSDIHVAPARESICSICVNKETFSDNTFYWYPRSSAENLEEAFETYIAPAFFDEYAAASAEAEFLGMVERAKKGTLEPINELKLMNTENTNPEIIFEIKTQWPNTRRSATTSGYLGARLFHGEPKELPNSIVSVYLHCKKEDVDDEETRSKQTAAARTAAYFLGECRRQGWKELVAQ